jgi:hypothetical protein
LFRRRLPTAVFALIAVAAQPILHAADQEPALQFRIDEAPYINSFVRDGPVAAHLVLRSGAEPRIIIAFPAGNSGIGVWFERLAKPVTWKVLAPPHPTSVRDAQGRPLRGIVTELEANAPTLQIREALLSSVRVLRDYQSLGTVPREVLVEPSQVRDRLTWERDRLDGAAGYRLSIEAANGDVVEAKRLHTGSSSLLRLRITAVTGETPLTPIPAGELLTSRAGLDLRARQVLTFLSYREKFLAGSWRFNTYFGRDTLMSMALLGPALQPRAIEDGIGSVLERLSPDGEVAHEEEVGEFAVLRNREAHGSPRGEPRYDYGMIDGSFLLPIVLEEWLLDDPRGRRRATIFLATRTASGETYGQVMMRNLHWILAQTTPFARDPVPGNLISIKSGRNTGQWRDSEQGLGGGRYPYDVNVALVPAALDSIQRLHASGLLARYGTIPQRQRLAESQKQLRIWERYAPVFFEVQVSPDDARAAVSRYASRVGIHTALLSRPLPANEPLRFDALSLDAAAHPIPIMHSDVGFTLLFGNPTSAQLARALGAITRQFPEGLWTPIGVMVASPAFAGDLLQGEFGRSAYHGTVVWSWQQAVLAAGLERQLARPDVPDELREELARARALLWAAIDAASSFRSSELWSWSFSGGCYRIEPFGASSADVDESNAAQLWSTVFLAIRHPSEGDVRSQGPDRPVRIGSCVR